MIGKPQHSGGVLATLLDGRVHTALGWGEFPLPLYSTNLLNIRVQMTDPGQRWGWGQRFA